MAAPPTFLLFDETGWDRLKFGRNRHPFRHRTELRNKLSPSTLVDGCGPSKTTGILSVMDGIALYRHLPTGRP